MDNAGGHRTGNAINQYTKILEGENIEIIWQVTRSTETNFLDLRFQMTIQSSVQKVHWGRRCTHTDLSKSVSNAWNKSLLVKTFKGVHARLRVVLVCVVDGKWSDEFTEKKRGFVIPLFQMMKQIMMEVCHCMALPLPHFRPKMQSRMMIQMNFKWT